MTRRRHEFTAEETAELLDVLDARLRERGVAGSIFVVGGAAIAANRTRRERAAYAAVPGRRPQSPARGRSLSLGPVPEAARVAVF